MRLSYSSEEKKKKYMEDSLELSFTDGCWSTFGILYRQ